MSHVETTMRRITTWLATLLAARLALDFTLDALALDEPEIAAQLDFGRD
jgi:hypothetical protein